MTVNKAIVFSAKEKPCGWTSWDEDQGAKKWTPNTARDVEYRTVNLGELRERVTVVIEAKLRDGSQLQINGQQRLVVDSEVPPKTESSDKLTFNLSRPDGLEDLLGAEFQLTTVAYCRDVEVGRAIFQRRVKFSS